ncbi:hypothetical protein C8R45DRAFT_937532 [Mycena sanguinolenta]|nr:hypothetical protein C8R45DRAFT_937532 [Mycena sanguinolenta]
MEEIHEDQHSDLPWTQFRDAPNLPLVRTTTPIRRQTSPSPAPRSLLSKPLQSNQNQTKPLDVEDGGLSGRRTVMPLVRMVSGGEVKLAGGVELAGGVKGAGRKGTRYLKA